MSSKSNGRIVDEQQRGLLQVTIWENQTQNGPAHSVTLKRSYQDSQGDWHTPQMIIPLRDLLQAAALLQWANERAYQDIAKAKAEKADASQHVDAATGRVTQESVCSTVVAGGPDDIPF